MLQGRTLLRLLLLLLLLRKLQAKLGVPWFAVSRHMLGLRHGQAGARKWRQVWSDHRLKNQPVSEVAALARKQLGSDPD